MIVALLTAGSHGDVRPFVALALGLQAAGHEVVLAAPSDAEAFVSAHGIPFASLGVDFHALAGSEHVRGATDGNGNLLAMRRAYRESRKTTRSIVHAAGRTALGADAIVYHPKTLVGAHVAEATGAQAWVALFAPALAPTRAFPVPLLPLPNLGPFNRATYAVTALGMRAFRGLVDEWRRDVLGLGPVGRRHDPFAVRGRPLPILYPISEALVPRPSDWLFPRCSALVHHGGSGTTAAGLRAGRPTVVCPFFGDQPFRGARVADVGAGPAPLAQGRPMPARLARAIKQAVSSRSMAANAERVGATIRREDGVAATMRLLER